MNDMTRTIERITSANPVPSLDAFPTRALSSGALLDLIDERSTAMTDTLTPIRPADPGKPPVRRGPLIAVAVAAIVLLVIGISTFTLLTGDDNTVVTEPPAPTTTTTTTIASGPQSLLPADTPPLEVAAAMQAAWDAGDKAGGEALIHPDSAYFAEGYGPDVAAEVWYRHATNVTIERECAEGIPPQLADLVFEGTMVTCTEVLHSGLNPGTVYGGTSAVTVLDGWIVDLYILDYQGATNEHDPQNPNRGYFEYRSWLRDTFPDRYPELFNPSSLQIVLDTPEAREGHREMVPVFLVDTGPRGDLALPADTPLLDVVATFQARFDAGDVPGYEAIFHPMTGYPSGNDAERSWFAAVTGMTADRTCTEVGPTQVSCNEVISSGLLPGVVVGETTTLWNGANGWIWTIESGDGSPFAFPGDYETGLAEYRTWVLENFPDQYPELFNSAALTIVLDTSEVRDAHRAMVQAYLEATAG